MNAPVAPCVGQMVPLRPEGPEKTGQLWFDDRPSVRRDAAVRVLVCGRAFPFEINAVGGA